MVAGGNPAKILCSVEEYFERNKKYDVKSYGMSAVKKKEYLLKF